MDKQKKRSNEPAQAAKSARYPKTAKTLERRYYEDVEYQAELDAALQQRALEHGWIDPKAPPITSVETSLRELFLGLIGGSIQKGRSR